MAKTPAGKSPPPRKSATKEPVATKTAAGSVASARKSATKAKPAPKTPKHPLMLNDQQWDREAVVSVVCNALACSSKSVGTILASGFEGHPLPDYSTVARWLAEPSEDGGVNVLCDMYARAKEAQADYMAEELAELHNKAWVPAFDMTGMALTGADGSPLMTVDKSSAALVRLESDNKKWLMSKLKPRKYGDKMTQELTGANGGAIEVKSTVTLVRAPVRRDEDEA